MEITASENTNKSSSSTRQAHINGSCSTDGSWGVNADASFMESSSESTWYTNSHLSANNIIIKSKNDTTVRGGVVMANNTLDLNVGGNLLVESLQDKSTSGSHSLGLSAGYSSGKDGSGINVGGNFSVSSSTKKWVTEQTSLTGNSVNIYVENKTILKGAVIASTSNDLTLDTGSFEYIHIKDKDISYNFGGGANAGANYTGKPDEKNNTWSVNASYGFSQKRQTNFATIGEGTIIVRDGETDLSKLNRDVTISQYGTVNIGLKGGFTVDSSTVDFVTDPGKKITDAIDSLEKGYNDAKKTTEEIYAESVIIYEKTGNLLSYGEFGLNGDYNVQNARVRDQLEKYGIMLSTDEEAGLYRGRSIMLEDGKLIRVGRDESGLWNTSVLDIYYLGDRDHQPTIGTNDYVSSYDTRYAIREQNYGISDDKWVNSWQGTALLIGIPAVISSPVWGPKLVGGVLAYEGAKMVIIEATIMGNVNGVVQVGSNMLINNDYSFKGNTTAYGAGFVTGVATSLTGNITSPAFANFATGLAGFGGDIVNQAAMNMQSGKKWDTNISYEKAAFSGVLNAAGMNITAPYLGGTTKLTLPEKTAVDTMFLVPTLVGTDALFDKKK